MRFLPYHFAIIEDLCNLIISKLNNNGIIQKGIKINSTEENIHYAINFNKMNIVFNYNINKLQINIIGNRYESIELAISHPVIFINDTEVNDLVSTFEGRERYVQFIMDAIKYFNESPE